MITVKVSGESIMDELTLYYGLVAINIVSVVHFVVNVSREIKGILGI